MESPINRIVQCPRCTNNCTTNIIDSVKSNVMFQFFTCPYCRVVFYNKNMTKINSRPILPLSKL